jgi:hypothetical protein
MSQLENPIAADSSQVILNVGGSTFSNLQYLLQLSYSPHPEVMELINNQLFLFEYVRGRKYLTYLHDFKDQQKAAVELARLVDGTVFPAVSFGPLAHALCKLIPSNNRTVCGVTSISYVDQPDHGTDDRMNFSHLGGFILCKSIEDINTGRRTTATSSGCRCTCYSLRGDQAMGGRDSVLERASGGKNWNLNVWSCNFYY